MTSTSTDYIHTMRHLFTSIHTAYKHSSSGRLYNCHNCIRLPGNLVICISSWSRTKHNVYLGVAFWSKKETPVDLLDWYKEWYSELSLLSSDTRSPDSVLQPEDYGLEIITKVGRLSRGQSQVVFDLVWNPEPSEGCKEGCNEYQVVQEIGTGRMVFAGVPMAPPVF
jgi:hypothetical protein